MIKKRPRNRNIRAGIIISAPRIANVNSISSRSSMRAIKPKADKPKADRLSAAAPNADLVFVGSKSNQQATSKNDAGGVGF
jgi:hypothetical protein